jgi:hypothetical protein
MRVKGAVVTLGAIAAVAITSATGAPSTLPEIALSSAVLFHLERAAALLTVYVFVLVILSRASRGELPSEMSGQGIKYSAEQAKEVTEQALVAITDDIERLKARIDDIERQA